MNRVSRRQFLLFSLSFVATIPLQKVIRFEKSRTSRRTAVQPQRAYGVGPYGQGAYGEVSAHLPRISR